MPTTNAAVLRTNTEEDLERQLKEAKEELFNLRFQAATGQLESHGRLRTVRRDIARIYTILRERELGIIGFIEPEVEAEESETTADDEAGESTDDESTAKADQTETTDADSTEDGEPADAAPADEGDAK